MRHLSGLHFSTSIKFAVLQPFDIEVLRQGERLQQRGLLPSGGGDDATRLLPSQLLK